MKAVRIGPGSGVDKLCYEDMPDPEPGPNDILVRVRAAALNHLEVWAVQAPPGAGIGQVGRIPGSDVAGVVEAVGTAVRGVEIGSPVMVQPGLSCGTCLACLSGKDNDCPQYTIIGTRPEAPGGLAELVAVPAVNLIPKPDNLSFEDAASIPLVFVTAWHMLVTLARVRLGETVLVNAAGSGVGSTAIQIAKLHGARVIASAGSAPKLEMARQLGADEIINYTEQDLAQEARRLTDGRGIDLVFEHVGGEIFEKSVEALARGGRLVTCGATAAPTATLNVTPLFFYGHSIIGSFMGTKGELLEALRFVRSGQLRPVVDRVFPLSEARAAVQHLAERRQFGKVVLVP